MKIRAQSSQDNPHQIVSEASTLCSQAVHGALPPQHNKTISSYLLIIFNVTIIMLNIQTLLSMSFVQCSEANSSELENICLNSSSPFS
ncbi:hypothetical protein QTP88_024474 [Uroleucon formosanum]